MANKIKPQEIISCTYENMHNKKLIKPTQIHLILKTKILISNLKLF